MKLIIKNQKGNAALVVILVLILVAVLGYVGWQVYDARQQESNTTTNNQANSETNTAPVATQSDNADSVFCSEGNTDLFTNQTDLYVYKNAELGLEFSYPKQWGSVVVSEGNLLCVGPFVMVAGKAGEFGQGDDPLTSTSHGYYKEGNKYYTNWFKDAEDGPYEIERNEDLFKEVSTANGTALVLASDCIHDIGCSRVAMVNLNGDEYPGLGVRSDRFMVGQESDKDPDLKTYTFEQIVAELETFLKTVRAN